VGHERDSSTTIYTHVSDDLMDTERLSLKILMALLDILDCTMDDLIEPVSAAGARAEPRKAAAAGAGAARLKKAQ